jgi:hypothetical protein
VGGSLGPPWEGQTLLLPLLPGPLAESSGCQMLAGGLVTAASDAQTWPHVFHARSPLCRVHPLSWPPPAR